MRVEKRKVSGRETSEAATKLLEKLRERLFFGDASARRCAAFKLSWMQEDGLDVLKEILFRNDVPITARYAAGYGMRSMNGRMKKMALEVITEGLTHPGSSIREVCSHTLRLLTDRAEGRASLQPAARTGSRGSAFSGSRTGRIVIRDIPRRSTGLTGIRRPAGNRLEQTRLRREREPVIVRPRARVH